LLEPDAVKVARPVLRGPGPATGRGYPTTTTLIPVLTSFQERHGITDMVVVADAGMLSAGNLNALEDAGFSFTVGSRLTKAPYDLADHFERHGNYFTDGQILESSRVMGTRKAARDRRIVYQWSFNLDPPNVVREWQIRGL